MPTQLDWGVCLIYPAPAAVTLRRTCGVFHVELKDEVVWHVATAAAATATATKHLIILIEGTDGIIAFRVVVVVIDIVFVVEVKVATAVTPHRGESVKVAIAFPLPLFLNLPRSEQS